MHKLITFATLAVLTVALCTTGCATKSRTTDIKGMFISDSGQLAIGYVHVDAIPEGTESAVIHYKEDVALLSPSSPTHDIDITLTGTNAVNSAEGIVKEICKAFVAVAPNVPKASAAATSPIDLAKANADNATAVKLAKAEAKQAPESAKPSSGEPLQGDADCATGACDPK